jgi:phage-related baseplate assembly protein
MIKAGERSIPDAPGITPPVVPPAGTDSASPTAPTYGLQYVPDIDFAVKDPTIIQNEVVSDYESAFLALTGIAKTLAPGDPVRLLLLSVCEWLSHQRVIIDFTGKNNLLKYARDDYLDNLAALHGQRALRLQAQPASATLRFTLSAGLAFGVIIPKGTQCQAPNSIVFETTEDGIIPAALLFVDVPAQALDVGTVGNGFLPGQIQTVVNWNQPWGINVSNTTVTAGGSDQETDDQYRYRIWLAIESYSTCGPMAAYEFWALSAHPDIVQCVVHSEPLIAGECWLYPLLRNGANPPYDLPTQEILDLVLSTCNDVKRRPLTDYVFAFAPVPFLYTLNMTYYVLSANEVVLDSIANGVHQAVLDWILWQRSYVGRDLNVDELIKRCVEAGAKRVTVTSPTPFFQVMNYNQLACHDASVQPIISFGGLEDQ